MQGNAAIALDYRRVPAWGIVQLVNIGSYIVKAFRPEKKSVPFPMQAGGCQSFIQIGMAWVGGKSKVFGAAFRVKSTGNGNRFQQSGFSGTVFPYQKGNGSGKR